MEERPSGLGPNFEYDRWGGDLELISPTPRPLDASLGLLCRQFRDADEARRSKMRAALTPRDIWTLVRFARRQAVFGLRERSSDHVLDGLTAIAMIDPRGEDPRDMPPRPLGLLDHVARTIGESPDRLMRETAIRSTTEMARLIERFAGRPHRSLSESMYMVTETPVGPGFVDTSVKPYHPTRPLDRIAFAIGALVTTHSYGAVRITVGENLQRYWLEGVDDARVSRAVRTIRGVVTIGADLRPEASADGDPNPPPVGASRILQVFLVELETDESSEALLRVALAKAERCVDVGLLGVRDDRVFCLLVGRSCVIGVPPVETRQTMRRFEAPVLEILRAHPIG
jgi:hypothetical protein